MNLFWKIYSVVLVLFIVVICLVTLQVSSRRIAETETLLIEHHRLTGSMVSSEVQRWHAEGKWPFAALRKLAGQDNFLFWWIVADDKTIYLADKVEYVGTDSGAYFPAIRERLKSAGEDGKVVLNRAENYGIFSQVFTVGNERWSFWLGFSTGAIREAKTKIIFSTLFYSLIALVFLGGFLLVIVRQFLKPLKELSQGTKKIGEGDLAYRLNTKGRDEIDLVAEAFNQMAASLQRDISKRAQAEKALKESEGLYRSLVENINMGITLIDQDHNIVMTNTAQGRMFNKTASEFSGKKCFQEFEKRDQICPHCPGVGAMEKGLPAETIAQGQRDDGSTFTVNIKAFPLQVESGQKKGFIEVVEDITEQIKMERELLKVKKLESVGVLAGGIAHDFNNILAAILGSINLAIIDADLKGETKKLLSEAERATLRAKDLTQQLLTFAKGGEPVKKVSSLEDVIKDSANFVLRGDKVACHYDIPEDLWLVDIDRGQISQVVQNIVLNASHAMPEGGTIKVTSENLASVAKEGLSFAKEGRFVKISIQDSGIGMPAEVVEKIFDPYFTRKHGGSGLGLAITQSIINKHNGYISVESTPGVGSTFRAYLPASEKSQMKKRAPLVENQNSCKARILVMDDDEMLRSVTNKMLARLGNEVVLSVDGEEAIKLYRDAMNTNNPFDLVIMDLTIPGGMGGEEAVREILKIDSTAKVIVSSGYSNDPIMANFKDYGFCAAIVKPFLLQELSKVISKLTN
ncbi:MAG: HAMP domain-containing protein [Desulfobulbaceae bacterium]|nr:HAMP domain-containing protein [Desulfobulbaceae bacterium]